MSGMAIANLSDRKYGAFLASLAIDGNVTRAANAAGVDRSNAYQRRLRNPEFANRWDEAIEAANDAIEAEARRRAVDGVEEPVFYKGVQVGVERRYSDGLLIALLKRHRPEYCDSSRVEIANAPDEVLKVESLNETARSILFLLELGRRETQQSNQDLT